MAYDEDEAREILTKANVAMQAASDASRRSEAALVLLEALVRVATAAGFSCEQEGAEATIEHPIKGKVRVVTDDVEGLYFATSRNSGVGPGLEFEPKQGVFMGSEYTGRDRDALALAAETLAWMFERGHGLKRVPPSTASRRREVAK
jgi:hypothetical protein